MRMISKLLRYYHIGTAIVLMLHLLPVDAVTRLKNLSTQGFIDNSQDFGLSTGFIIDGHVARRFVVMGESAGTLHDPLLLLTDLSGSVIYEQNDNWQDHSTAAEVIAQLRPPQAELDAAFAVTLQPGAYIAHLESADGGVGMGTLSVTDLQFTAGSDTNGLINLSANGVVTQNGLTSGMIIAGTAPQRYVVMAEESTATGDLNLRLANINGLVLAANDNWHEHGTANEIASQLRPPQTETDAGFAVTLPPGVYLAQVQNNDHTPAQTNLSVTQLAATPSLQNLGPNQAVNLGPYPCSGPEPFPKCQNITDFSGMVYDAKRHQIVMFGGGHASTFTDTVARFDLISLSWSELYPHTPCASMNKANHDASQGAWLAGEAGPYPRPTSRHSYDLLAIVADELILLAGEQSSSGTCAPQGLITKLSQTAIAHYDLDHSAWQFAAAPTFKFFPGSDVDPVTQ